MYQQRSLRVGQVASNIVLAALLLLGATTARAQATANRQSNSPGRIDFVSAKLPPATVEVDLGQEIFSDLFGLGDAAIAGVIESLAKSNETQGTAATELAADKLVAARQIVQLAKEVVREVRVRVYDKFSEEQGNAAELAARFDEQLASGNWDNVIKVRDDNNSVHVSFLRVEGSILGLFVVVADGKDVVLANIVCDVSPENVKNLTAAATKIGLENGLREVLERELKHHLR